MMKHASEIALCMALLWTSSAQAMAPQYISDEQLAESPIIVIAKWEKAPFESHNKYKEDKELGTVVTADEAYTKLHILRIVKGTEMTEGEHDLMLGWGIAWSKDGTSLSSGTSSMIRGEVEDITKPNLWFLTRARSWDETRPGTYLSISNYRQIQPAELEEYFLALGSHRAASEVPLLLTPKKPEVALRVLRYIAGGMWPWPYDPDEFDRDSNPESRGNMLRKEAKKVWEIVNSEDGELRPYAVSVYAELKGADCREDIRTLLRDKDPLVRGIAIGILARHRDNRSLGEILQAIRGVDEGWLACKLIDKISSWGDERLAPSLITYLQNCDFAYQYGDDVGIPALKARLALKKITGHWFPYDVEQSMSAWQKAGQVTDKAKRRKVLEQLIPGSEFPVVAELVGEPTYQSATISKASMPSPSLRSGEPEAAAAPERAVSAIVRIRNITKRPIMIAERPLEVSMSWPAGCTSSGGWSPQERVKQDNVIALDPGKSLEFTVKLNESFLTADPGTRSLRLSYFCNGKSMGPNVWIGTLEVKPGSQWKEKRETEQIEETWPNGNLKGTGKTVNGHKLGAWNYFNEHGDRIKVVYYGEGRAEATCNPEHPDNKGAGRRPQAMLKPNKAINDGEK